MTERRKFYGMRNDYMFHAVLQKNEEVLRNLLATLLEMDEAELEKEYLDETYRTMVLSMIRQQENITLSDEQMQEKLEEYAQENEYDTVEDLLADYDEEDLREYFLNEMTLDFLEEHADIAVSEK